MSHKKTPEQFQEEITNIYSGEVVLLTPYTKLREKILVRYCSCGHEQMKAPSKLLAGQGCGLCKFKKLSETKTRSQQEYIDALKQRGIAVDVLSEYTGRVNKITVRNQACGHVYSANAGNILRGSGCPICHGMKDTKMFIDAIEQKYPGEYTIIGEYKNNRTPIKVTHKCGYTWEVIPKDLLRSIRCPNCIKSKGELFVKNFLDSAGLSYKCQHIFPECRDSKPLPFDFVVEKDNHLFAIEFDGSQHFGNSNYWGDHLQRSKISLHDRLKNEYCTQHNIPLLRIPYWWLRSDRAKNELKSFLMC
ncbi:hypothetical protein [Anaeromassilibacillus senegalensis]|uniref:hypothetical protein n=1 Tax=Anaeromassilibacillus senegalensis TaxID=1673717 RepID=UPI0006830F11|nr:hypothetical protein [Anaeromassilibacillus senegalensis]